VRPVKPMSVLLGLYVNRPWWQTTGVIVPP
jgi:hypothetical protein